MSHVCGLQVSWSKIGFKGNFLQRFFFKDKKKAVPIIVQPLIKFFRFFLSVHTHEEFLIGIGKFNPFF